MTINADTLLDRLYLKGQITKWRILAIVFGVLVFVVSFERFLPNSPMESDFIARLTIDGVIFDDQKIYDLINDVKKNKKIKAVIVSLDTPGGSAVGGEEVYLRLRELAAEKPTVAVMRSVAASAGYMIALGTDQIYAREGTITGSIGVIIETADLTSLAEKIGIKPIIFKSAPLKGMPSPFEKSTPESEKVVQDVVNDFYARFVQMLAERRGLPTDRATALADGRIYSGKGALNNKLIDAIGGEQDAIKWLVEQKHIKSDLSIKDVKPAKDDSIFSELTQSVTGKFFESSSLSLDGLVAIWHPQLN